MSVCEIIWTASSCFRPLPRRAVGFWRSCLGFGDEREVPEYLGSCAAAGKHGTSQHRRLRITASLESTKKAWKVHQGAPHTNSLRMLLLGGGEVQRKEKEGVGYPCFTVQRAVRWAHMPGATKAQVETEKGTNMCHRLR